MPITDGQPQLVLHPLAADHAILVVVAVPQRRAGLGAGAEVSDGLDAKKGTRGHGPLTFHLSPRG